MSMALTPCTLVVLCGMMFTVALLYASVGHGGASGYLAAWSFVGLTSMQMATSALWLNVLVAGTAWWTFGRRGYFLPRLSWPFIVASVPAAFLGGWLPISPHVYGWLLAGTLVVAAWRLLLPDGSRAQDTPRAPRLVVALPVGAGVGFLSGVVGIGGGIFLSPLLLLLHWATPQQTAATSACFIVANSVAALAGRAAHGDWLIGNAWPVIVSAFLGGLVGARLGAHHCSGRVLRRLLAVTLVVASIKLLMRIAS